MLDLKTENIEEYLDLHFEGLIIQPQLLNSRNYSEENHKIIADFTGIALNHFEKFAHFSEYAFKPEFLAADSELLAEISGKRLHLVIDKEISVAELTAILAKHNDICSIILNRCEWVENAPILELPVYSQKLANLCQERGIQLYIKGDILDYYLTKGLVNRSELSDVAFLKWLNAIPVLEVTAATNKAQIIRAIELINAIYNYGE